MSACLSRQLIRGRFKTLPSFLRLQFWSGISVQNANCTCVTVEYPVCKYRQCQQTRTFSTTQLYNADTRTGELFDQYYAAVLKAHRSNENLILYKYRALPDNPVEREIHVKKWMFIEAVDIYIEKSESPHQSGLRRGHLEFIKQALNRMNELGIHRELACYNALLKVFPPDIMVPTNVLQNEMYHFPKQQDATFEVLEQMEDNAIMPDQETRDLLTARFGKHGPLVRKVRRTMYWFRKFQNANPYKLPFYLPFDPIELAILALKKMAVDLENQIKIFKVTEHGASSFIVSAQSPAQREMISGHPESDPLYVEGGYMVWLRDRYQTYFVLKAESDPKVFKYPTKEEIEDNLEFETIFDDEEPTQLATQPSVHQQEDGTILAMCVTGTGSKDSLISWIRCLQEENPCLENIPVVFKIRSPEESLVPVPDFEKDQKNEQVEESK